MIVMEVSLGSEHAMEKIAKTYANSISEMLATYLSAKLTFVKMGVSVEDASKILSDIEDMVMDEYKEPYKEAEAVFTGKISVEEFMLTKIKEKINE